MEILEILKYVIPSLVVMGCAWLTNKQFLKRDETKEKVELLIQNNKLIVPVKLAAYERLILFLSRMEPQSVVPSVTEPNMMAIELQRNLLITIKAEFEHNFSQQLYVSDTAWKAVRDTKDVILQLVNQSAQGISPDAKASELGRRIIENYANLEVSPIDSAIALLKSELSSVI